MAIFRVALHRCRLVATALHAWRAYCCDEFTNAIETALYLTAFFFVSSARLLGRRCSGRYDRACSISVRHIHMTFVTWAAVPVDSSFVTFRYGRRTCLLQTDNITSEAEAKITRVRSRNLRSALVYATFIHALSGGNCHLLFFIVIGGVKRGRLGGACDGLFGSG